MHSYIFLESTEVHYSFYFSANIFAKSFFLPPSHLRLFWLQPRGCPGFLEKGVHLLLGLLEEGVHLLLTIWESFTVCFACWNTRVYTSLFDVFWCMRYWDTDVDDHWWFTNLAEFPLLPISRLSASPHQCSHRLSQFCLWKGLIFCEQICWNCNFWNRCIISSVRSSSVYPGLLETQQQPLFQFFRFFRF